MNVKVLYIAAALGIASLASLAMALFVFQPIPPVSGPALPVQQASVQTAEVQKRPQFGTKRRGLASVAEVEAGLKRIKTLPKQQAARERVRLIRGLPSVPGGKSALARLAKSGSAADRLVAVNVLWARGEHDVAREAAEGDRLLAAKISALSRKGSGSER